MDTSHYEQARAYLTGRFGADNFRIEEDGTIHANGKMPCSIDQGWYEFGSLRELETLYRIGAIH